MTANGHGWSVYQGHAEDVILHHLKRDPWCDCVVTSPPYWGLRDYGCEEQIGLEVSLEDYLDRLCAVFAAVHLVMKDTGTLWVNMGDVYATESTPGLSNAGGGGWRGERGKTQGAVTKRGAAGIKPKDLIGLPWMLAFALREAGWWLRAEVIWEKSNPNPESVSDRPTRSHENLFLFSKAERYYYDAVAIAEPSQSSPSDKKKMREKKDRIGGKTLKASDPRYKTNRQTNIGRKRGVDNWEFRNCRTVWRIATTPSHEEHYAIFPEKLVYRCIMAGCPESGIVFDPFMGSGTTGVVARKLGRKVVGIDVSPKYVEMARRRIGEAAPLLDYAESLKGGWNEGGIVCIR